MSINKLAIAKDLKTAVLSQPNLRNRAEIADMFWLLTDEPDDYNIESEVQQMIKSERLKQGLSQVKLAGRAGLAQSRMTDFDNGMRVPHLDHLQKIAHGLGKRLVISFEDIDETKTTVA